MATQLIDRMPGTPLTVGTGTPTIALTFRALAAAAARQSAKYDLGAGPWANEYQCRLQCILAAAATAGATVTVYIGYSASGTAATDNSGGCSGSDAAYTGISGGTIAQSVLQLDRVGSLIFDVNILANHNIGRFTPKNRYIYFVVVNSTAQALTNANDTDNIMTILPINDRAEAAV